MNNTPNHTGQRDAIREIMRREERPLSVGEIVMFLGQSDWKWTSFDPNDSVKTSLKKSRDLVRISHNRWIWESLSYDQKRIRAARPKVGPGDKSHYRWVLIDPEKVQASRDKATQDRKDGGLGLAPSGRCEQERVAPLDHGIDGLLLERAQRAPTEAVDDVVLECRVKAVERFAHRSSSMSSALFAALALRSRSVNSLSAIVSA